MRRDARATATAHHDAPTASHALDGGRSVTQSFGHNFDTSFGPMVNFDLGSLLDFHYQPCSYSSSISSSLLRAYLGNPSKGRLRDVNISGPHNGRAVMRAADESDSALMKDISGSLSSAPVKDYR
ncbi:hypothetical protein EVAR_98344_1 [Eumeta japonica]|uniref:Uncharacterized protein n=1 Tax=Eumeta variegata TaxID=151549 RepID=A0A4C1XE30_EUMVA|nr:hypothetical protein EVAR_98344_1 [Eumeta japonica]